MRILRYIDTRIANARARVLVLLRARDVEVLHLCLLRREADYLDHGTVDRTRPTAAARDEHRLFRRIKVKRRRTLRPRCCEHLGTDGVARDVGLFRGKDAPRILHPDGDRRRKTGEDTVRHPRHGVLLLHERRDARETRREENRPRNVAARPDGDVGMKAMHDAARPRNGTHSTPCPQYILEREMPLEAREIDGDEVQPLARHDVRLQTVGGTDVEDACRRLTPLDRADNRECRVDVTARAAARYDDVHSSFTSLLKSRPRSS